MNRLLNAGFRRLFKDKIFWICVIASIALGLTACFSQYNNMLKYKIEVDSTTFILSSATMIGIILAIFTCLFVGTDYSDGTIRNKLIIGHTRKAIYFSNLIISVIAGLIINAIYMLVISAVSIALFGAMKLSAATFIWLVIDLIFLTIAYSSIFNMITLICSNKTISIVLSFLLLLGLFIISVGLLSRLQASEFMNAMSIVNGKGVIEKVKNPMYLEGMARKVYQFALDFIPIGQGLQITGSIAPNIKFLAIYSFIISLTLNLIGSFTFNKKDLK